MGPMIDENRHLLTLGNVSAVANRFLTISKPATHLSCDNRA
jgi:hypothetical protein